MNKKGKKPESKFQSVRNLLRERWELASILNFLQITLKTKRVNSQELPKANIIWPIIGHLHLLGGSKLPHHVYIHCVVV
ncbi:hypothetical protein HanRHA438_Chr03g0108021 [Helianthus annuus]|uniref:Uncharacterized protein n=1 Tax=Helianthus annuus TaxID=4232 RepID=A0A251UTK9_HELAN|nr:hypothetical protein HanXRQr2_Chr03g0096911 [Helianthus annuus]KAJ0934491.1 hypothetical protein HanRHA438_Chr03g0108021 [Helianthus annuus]KAJ0942562.1 hypothetical protein HanPSC8_Chr03g0093431 [Helianthus annuus]